KHSLTYFQGRFHRTTGDPIGLDDERLYRERQANRDQHDHDQLNNRVRSGLRLAPALSLLHRGGSFLHAEGSPAPVSPASGGGSASSLATVDASASLAVAVSGAPSSESDTGAVEADGSS